MTASMRVPALSYPVDAMIALPGSKSHANRAIICAALASGTTHIRNATPCEDVDAMVDNLRVLGFDLRWENREGGILMVHGGIPRSKLTARSSPLDCHNAGTTLRFLTSLASLVPGNWTVTGNAHMQKRPIGDLVSALRSLGAEIDDANACPPIRLSGGALRGGKVTLKASISSQYLSSLLLVAPMLQGGLQIELDGPLASSGYVDLTLRVMSEFGVDVRRNGSTFTVPQIPYRASGTYDIEGDWSAAGPWLALNAISGSSVQFSNLLTDSSQSDRAFPAALAGLPSEGDATVDCTEIPDQVMNLAVRAAFRRGKTTITGAKNLRFKECDRLAVTRQELAKAGVQIEEHDDGLIVAGLSSVAAQTSPLNITLDPHDDHRMVMAFSVLGLVRGGVTVLNPACVGKSYPRFLRDLRDVQKNSKPIVIVGMRGVGKTNFGRRLASKLRLRFADADKLFEKQYGNIRTFVEQKGWPTFRLREEEVIASALRRGYVLSLGGGAVLSEKTRSVLSSGAIVIWLDADDRELIRRLKSGKRPPLTDLPIEQEVPKISAERRPFYESVARIHIPKHLRFSLQVPFAVRALRSIVNPLLPKR